MKFNELKRIKGELIHTYKGNNGKTYKETIYYFKLVNKKGVASKTIYFLNGYCRELKKWSISPFNDINKERFIKSNQEIEINFEF